MMSKVYWFHFFLKPIIGYEHFCTNLYRFTLIYSKRITANFADVSNNEDVNISY